MINLKTKIMSIVAIVATLALISTAIPAAHAQVQSQPVEGTVTIVEVCGMLVSPIAINYGTLAPNAESTDQTVNVQNTGNAEEDVAVSGTPWSTLTSPQAMLVGATHYSITSGQAYATKTALAATDAPLTTLVAAQAVDSFWQLKVVLNDQGASGLATQTVTFTGTC
jgi:hypothetical protein